MNTRFKIFSKSKPSKGFVALFTVLIASVVLAMAVGISNIALKQIVLTASATDANKAFYAADSGIECALYHDFKAPPPPNDPFDPNQAISQIPCGGATVQVQQTAPGIFLPFRVPAGLDGELCAYVTLRKPVGGLTTIVSRGVNVPCDSIDANPRMVERAIEVTY